MKMKLMRNKKYLQQIFFTKRAYTLNYNQFYVEGQQELCPFYM